MSASVKAVLEGLITEIGAGRCLPPLDSERKVAWNQAHERCLSIARQYQRGEGLFQEAEPE